MIFCRIWFWTCICVIVYKTSTPPSSVHSRLAGPSIGSRNTGPYSSEQAMAAPGGHPAARAHRAKECIFSGTFISSRRTGKRVALYHMLSLWDAGSFVSNPASNQDYIQTAVEEASLYYIRIFLFCPSSQWAFFVQGMISHSPRVYRRRVTALWIPV